MSGWSGGMSDIGHFEGNIRKMWWPALRSFTTVSSQFIHSWTLMAESPDQSPIKRPENC